MNINNLINGEGSEYLIMTKHKGTYGIFLKAESIEDMINQLITIRSNAIENVKSKKSSLL
jgi:hypothetical protein